MPEPIIKMTLIISLFSTLFACSSRKQADIEGWPRDIDCAEASRMLSSDNPPAIVDVRTPAEFTGELGHIPGARLVPLNLLGDSLGVLSQYKERDLILVCRTGRRSGIAARELAKVGFARVYNLQGGMVQWNHARGTAG